MLRRARRRWAGLVSSYWFIPTTILLVASALALALVEVDAGLDAAGRSVGFTGGPASARELLSAIASSTLTLTALVFSNMRGRVPGRTCRLGFERSFSRFVGARRGGDAHHSPTSVESSTDVQGAPADCAIRRRSGARASALVAAEPRHVGACP